MDRVEREKSWVGTLAIIRLCIFSHEADMITTASYGGPSPCVGGSVVLSLYRMDRIVEVNEKAAYAVVEPGVTFFDLYNYCRDNKLALWPSVPAISWGSVVGNVCDPDHRQGTLMASPGPC